MNTANATQLSNEFQSALSEILPGLYQLCQNYRITKSINIDLKSPNPDDFPTFRCIRCIDFNGSPYYVCGPNPACLLGADDNSGLELPPEKVEQFCTDLASKLSTIGARLSQSQPIDAQFAVQILIHPPRMSCQLVDGVLVCSDQPQ
jgi:hypothetical protein